jgi:hypothetical protein
MCKHLILALSLLFSIRTASVLAQAHPYPIPSQGLTPYSSYRELLIKMGWKPYRINPDLSITYGGYPELICGNTFCTATFRSGGEQLTLNVWFIGEATDDSKNYVVAPSFSIE